METNQLKRFEVRTIREEIVKQMDRMQTEKFVILPEKYKESVFFAIEKMSGLEDIEKVPAVNIAKALISMFNNKLDYTKNHCYFFVQNDKHSATGKSLRFGWQYQGLISVAKATCGVTSIIPVLVYENDKFSSRYDFGELIIENHEPTFEGKIIGGYCVVKFQDETKSAKYYTSAEMERRRSASKAPNGQFWKWEREMYEKTLINATLKRIIETSGEVEAENLYSEPETVQPRQTIEEAEVIDQSEPEETETAQPKKINLNNL